MADLIPPDVPPPDTAPDDPRLGRWLAGGDREREGGEADVLLVGFPSDEGVRRNGGRPGAAAGPRAIREALYRLTPDARLGGAFDRVLERTADLGDVRITGDLEEDQERLGEALGPLLQIRSTIIVLGGGHETAYGHFLGYARAGLDVRILNWDAHADVRPLRGDRGHSGSPFRQALGHPTGRCRGYSAAGLQPSATAAAHFSYVQERGGEAVWADELDAARVDALTGVLAGPAYVSFDLDGVEASSAPGVSAPSPAGMPVTLWLRAAEAAGRSPAVRSIDVVELNPYVDADGRTARLAALTVWHFLRGLALGER